MRNHPRSTSSFLLLFLACLLMVPPTSGQIPGSFQPVCRDLWDWIRDPHDCGRFWRCSWGAPVEMPRCADGQVLNNVLHVCVGRGSLYDDCEASAPATATTPTGRTTATMPPGPTTATTPTGRTTATMPPGPATATTPTGQTSSTTTTTRTTTATTPTSTASTTTSKTDSTTLGFSIFEYCSRDFKALIPHPEECQAYYNCSQVYDTVPKFFEQYLAECPYPKLFDSQRRVCDDFWNVDCGTRKEAVTACDYRRYQCQNMTSCTPCDVAVPSCIGRLDGQNPVSNISWTRLYITCRAGRTVSQGLCDPHPELNVEQLFSPVLRKCVPLYDVPKANGGLQPSCTGRATGTYPEESGRRPDLFYVCNNGQYAGMNRCPSSTVYNAVTKLCQQDVTSSTPRITASPSPTSSSPSTTTPTATTTPFDISSFVWQTCNQNATALIPHPLECQSFYNCSLKNGVVPRWLQSYLDECPYPKLFDTARMKCDYIWNVDCDGRKEPSSACEYRNYVCQGDGCSPCDVPASNCGGKVDGNYPVSETQWSQFYITCLGGQFLGYTACDVHVQLNVPRVFSPILRKCVHLYDVPAANGGLQPDCSGREDALYAEDSERADLFYMCTNYQYNGIYRCPDNNYFDSNSRECRPVLTTTPPTTSATSDTTLGFSIFEYCSRDFTALIPHPEECQAYYNCSQVYDDVPRFFEQYLVECPYPKLFDSQRRVCDDFWNVNCGTRKEAITACDYRTYMCPQATCTPCEVVVPSCAGREDGQQALSDTAWTFMYITCQTGRTVYQGRCDLDHNLDVPQVFSPLLRRCVHLYDVPAAYGGLQPSCSGRMDGKYAEDNGRPDLYYVCSGGLYMGMYRCPNNTAYSALTQACLRSDWDFF